jgi:hypothetical protein
MQHGCFFTTTKQQLFLPVLPARRKYAITIQAIAFQAFVLAVLKRTTTLPHQKYGYDNWTLIKRYRKPDAICFKELFRVLS